MFKEMLLIGVSFDICNSVRNYAYALIKLLVSRNMSYRTSVLKLTMLYKYRYTLPSSFVLHCIIRRSFMKNDFADKGRY